MYSLQFSTCLCILWHKTNIYTWNKSLKSCGTMQVCFLITKWLIRVWWQCQVLSKNVKLLKSWLTHAGLNSLGEVIQHDMKLHAVPERSLFFSTHYLINPSKIVCWSFHWWKHKILQLHCCLLWILYMQMKDLRCLDLH